MMIVRDKKQRAIETVTEVLKGNWPLAETIVRNLSDAGLTAHAERDRICAMLREPTAVMIEELREASRAQGQLAVTRSEAFDIFKTIADLIETGASHDAG